MCNGRLEPDSLSLALSTRVTAHESGTCAPSFAPLHVHWQWQTSASRHLHRVIKYLARRVRQ